MSGPREWVDKLPRAAYKNFRRVSGGDDWFAVYDLGGDVLAIYEDGQIEEVISYLILGNERALLIDSGNGIGDIRAQCRRLTGLPIVLVNTHCHYDHIGMNYMFDEVYAFDDARGIARRTAALGYAHEDICAGIEDYALNKPLPAYFAPEKYRVVPYRVSEWIADGHAFRLGGRDVTAIHTPGHSPDSLCFLDAATRSFFVGDIFYTGPIYTWLEGGDLDEMVASYKRMIRLMPEYDTLMPSHNEPAVGADILHDVLRAAREVRDGGGNPTLLPNGHKRYDYGVFSFDTAPPDSKIANFMDGTVIH